MADIKHSHAAGVPTGPTEGDGISYRGIVWFVVILAVTTLVSAGLMWWFHAWSQGRAKERATAAAVTHPMEAPPPPNLITLDSRSRGEPPKMPEGEPSFLKRFRAQEDAALSGYGWVDQNAGVVRIPIERAKALVLERGLPVRPAK